MESLSTAFRRALRRLWRSPGFTVAAVATLAIGIGATTAIFTLVHGVLLRALPFPAADRLVALRHVAPGFGITDGGQSEGTFLHYRRGNHTLEAMGVYLENEVTVTDQDAPQRVPMAMVTPSVFGVLGAQPLMGRLFTEADGADDAPNVAVISHALWVSRYGADPKIIGRQIELNRSRREIVGVLPPSFHFPRPETEMWYPMGISATRARVRDLYLTGIGRLRRGASAADAERDLNLLVPTLSEAYADATPDLLRTGGLRAVVLPLRDAVVRDVRPVLVLLAYTAAFVLLIAWANVASLALIRADGQQRDVAVERALGASSGEVASRFASESVVLAVAGGLIGFALAAAGVATRFGFAPDQIPRLDEVHVGVPAVLLALALTVSSAGVLAAASGVRSIRADLLAALKSGAGRSTASRATQYAQRGLVALQVALALTLLVVSGMMIASVQRLGASQLGFDPARTLSFDVALPFGPYPRYQAAAQFYLGLLDDLRHQPGVEQVGASMKVPLTNIPSYFYRPFVTDLAPEPTKAVPASGLVNLATPDYFDAMRIPLLRGRGLATGDAASDQHPVVVSAALAKVLFPGSDAIGHRVQFANRLKRPWFTVVGVVGDVPRASIPEGAAPAIYFPVVSDLAQAPDTVAIPYVPSEMTVIVRTRLAPVSLVAAARSATRQRDPRVPIVRVRMLDELVAASTARVRLIMLLLVVAAGAALFLGVLGLYSVVSYAVSRRTSELGVRLALGATPEAVRWMVIKQGVAVAGAGIVLGLFTAAGGARLLQGLLYQVSPTSPAAFAFGALVLLVVAVAASYAPARRAGRIAPATALKAE